MTLENTLMLQETSRLRGTYLDLMRKILLNTIYEDQPQDPWSVKQFDPVKRELGRDWPSVAHTMIGNRRLANLQVCCEYVLQRGIPGDFIETGVWRGGATILMKAVLHAYDDTTRNVWVADSFEGLPLPDADKYPHDRGDVHHTYPQLAISLEQVQAHFDKYGLLDDRVKFLKGWFSETLPKAPIEQLAILRLDGDMYESTMDAFTSLYHKLSPGGFLIVDDYGAVAACKAAVHDFRNAHGITEDIYPIDDIGVFWQRHL